MTRRSKLWLAVSSVFTAINLVGIGAAAELAEWPHAGVHVGLGLIGAWWMWRVASPWLQADAGAAQLASSRLSELQQSVDAVAVEVERIGEAQRFVNKVAAERAPPDPQKRN
jgi:hypothetical protein